MVDMSGVPQQRTACWLMDGTSAGTQLCMHQDLCEECLGPTNWCFCKVPQRPYHLNHFWRNMNPPVEGRFLQRNHQLTADDVMSFLMWIFSYKGDIPVVCPGCRKHLARASDCHEVGCCGWKMCSLCGYAARGPNLIDHYAGMGTGGCLLYPRQLNLNGMTCPCTANCQSLERGDCNVQQHAKWRSAYHAFRRVKWIRMFVRSLPRRLLYAAIATINRMFFPHNPVHRFPDTAMTMTGPPLKDRKFRREAPAYIVEAARFAAMLANDLQST